MIDEIIKNDPGLIASLYHRSVRDSTEPILSKYNLGTEVLDFWETLGKSIIDLYAIQNIISYPTFKEVGEASRAVQISSHQICDTLASALHSSQLIKFGLGVTDQEKNQSKILTSVAYTFIGAFCYFNGLSNTINNVLLVYSPVTKINVSSEKDHKTLIQELYQARKKPIPAYRLLKTEGENHNLTFWAEIKSFDNKSAIASGPSKRKAELNAAKDFFIKYHAANSPQKTTPILNKLDIKSTSKLDLYLSNRKASEDLLIDLQLPNWSLNLLMLAFVHRSFNSQKKLTAFGSDNRVLALIGSFVMQWAAKDAILAIQNHKEIVSKGGISNVSKESLSPESITQACQSYFQKNIHILGPGEKELHVNIKIEMIQALVGVIFLVKSDHISHYSDLFDKALPILNHLINSALTSKTRSEILGPKGSLQEICASCEISLIYDSTTTDINNLLLFKPVLELSSKHVEHNISIELPEQKSAHHNFLGKAALENKLATIVLNSFYLASGKKSILMENIEFSQPTIKWLLEHLFKIASLNKRVSNRKNKHLLEKHEPLGISNLQSKDFLGFARWVDLIKTIFPNDANEKIENSLLFYEKVGSSRNMSFSELSLFDDLERLESYLRDLNLLVEIPDIKNTNEFQSLIKNASALRFMCGKLVEVSVSELINQTDIFLKKRSPSILFSLNDSIKLIEVDGAHIALLDLLSQCLENLQINSLSIEIVKNNNNLEILIDKKWCEDFNLTKALSQNTNWNILIYLLPISSIIEDDLILKITIPSLIENKLSLLCWWGFNLPHSENLDITNTIASLLHDTKNELLAAISTSNLIKKANQKSEIYQLAANASRHIEQALTKINAANLVINSSKELTTKGFSLSDFLRSFIASLWTFVPSNIQLITPTIIDDCIIFTNEEALRSILINLIKNSIEAMSNGGRLWIEYLVHENNTLEFEIRDTGPGFSDSQLEKLNNGAILNTSKKDGNGIGLLTVFMLIKELAGELLFKNNLTSGSLIAILIPSQSEEVSDFSNSEKNPSVLDDKVYINENIMGR